MAEKPTPKRPVPAPKPQPKPKEPEIRSYGDGGKFQREKKAPINESAGPSGSPKK